MKELALSLEQMKYLEELGLDTSGASMYYETTNTYTLQDIWQLLPDKIICQKMKCGVGICYFWWINEINAFPIAGSDNLLTSAYNALIWCINNGYTEVKKK